MFIALLAAAAAACAPAPQAGVVRQPAFLSAPSTADLLAAIPATAAQNGVSGEADLACRADEAGYLTDCRVVSEEPAGMGFGEAALTLSTRYHLATLSAGGVAVACREVEIPVEFSVEGGDWRAARVDMVTRPTWTAAPSFDDLAGAWHGEDVEGPVRVVLDCQVRPDGSLERCRSEASSPFARAARSLAKDFRLDLRPGEFTPHRTLAVEVPIELRDPQSPAFQARAIGEPMWIAAPPPTEARKLYPAKAAQARVGAGMGTADCTVDAQGWLTNCAPGPSNPPDLGFSRAAVLLAPKFRMSLWTQEGGPVNGARIAVPMRFNLTPVEAADGTEGSP